MAHAEITVKNEVCNGARYAEQHIVRVVKTDGSAATQEVFLFARTDPQGRFAELQEVIHTLEGAESDRGIGSAR